MKHPNFVQKTAFTGLTLIAKIAPGLLGLATFISASTHAETVLSVTQTSYNYLNKPVCSAQRMNPVIYGSLPTDACALGTAGTYGPDRISKSFYDAAYEVTEVDQAYATSIQRAYARYTYSNNGLKKTEKDANSNLTTLTYDGFDRLNMVQYPNMTIASGNSSTTDYETFAYDNNGNQTSWRRRDAQVIGYSYDNLNHQIIKDLPGGTAKDVYTNYDGLGRITRKTFVSSSGSGVSYNYDGLSRVSSTTDTNGKTVWYDYNQASARIKLTYPDLNAIGYTLDYGNRLSTLGWNATSGLVAQGYDNLGRVSSISKVGGSTSFTYDAASRPLSMTIDLNGTGYDVTWGFGYNPASQIVSQSATSTVYDYKELTTSTVNKTYDGLNRDASIAALTGGYDTRQNLSSEGSGGRAFTYDVENHLLTATGNVVLDYDPEGRLSRYSNDGGVSYTTFLYDGTNLIAEYDSLGNVAERYIHGTGTDNPLVWLHGTGAADQRFLWANYQGSIISYTNSSGNPVVLYKYGPYGEPLVASNPATPNMLVASFQGARFRYTGQTVIPEASLYFYKARVYDPKYGRFLQTDPIGNSDDLDLYAYVGGDPTNKNDPSGTQSILVSVSNNSATETKTVLGPEDASGTTAPEEQTISSLRPFASAFLGNGTESEKIWEGWEAGTLSKNLVFGVGSDFANGFVRSRFTRDMVNTALNGWSDRDGGAPQGQFTNCCKGKVFLSFSGSNQGELVGSFRLDGVRDGTHVNWTATNTLSNNSFWGGNILHRMGFQGAPNYKDGPRGNVDMTIRFRTDMFGHPY